MDKLVYNFYKICRRVYDMIHFSNLEYSCNNPEMVAHKIFEFLTNEKPCMIARYGAFEIQTIANAIGVRQGRPSLIAYVKGKAYDWVWNERLLNLMESNAGFFPATPENAMKFAEMMIEESVNVDMLASWVSRESALGSQLKNSYKFPLHMLEPYWNEFLWTKAFEGKRILVIHPFADTIRSQYSKRNQLFKKSNIIPEFKSFEVIKAVQSMGGSSEFSSWFEALEYMKSEIDKHEFDICLIGCGAYGFPLGSYVKHIGKKSIVWGGSLQLYFGIMGNRWRNKMLYYSDGRIIGLRQIMTDSWVRPSESERPLHYKQVENGCYW